MNKNYAAWAGILVVVVLCSGLPVFANEEAGGQTPPPRPGFFDARMRAENAKDMLEQKDKERREFMENHASGSPLRILGSTTPEGLRGRFEEMRGKFFERRAHFASSTALREGVFSEEARERILQRADHVASLADAMIGRLTMILERMKARIESLSTAGVNTTDVETVLADAQEKIAEAEAAMQKVKDAIEVALASETPREEIEKNVKPLKEEAKTSLRAAYEALKAVANLLPRTAPAQEGTNE